MRPVNRGRTAQGRSGRGWPAVLLLLAGVAVGMALPRPFARAVQPPAEQQPAPEEQQPAPEEQQPPAPLPFPGAQPPPAGDPDAEEEGPAPPEPPIAARTFTAPAALIVNFVQPSGVGSFEALTRRLVAALAESEDPQHRAQAAGWTMYRAVEAAAPNNNAVFFWLLDPTAADANYAVPQLLNEMFPDEVQQLYEGYMQAFGVGQMVLDLEPVVLVDAAP